MINRHIQIQSILVCLSLLLLLGWTTGLRGQETKKTTFWPNGPRVYLTKQTATEKKSFVKSNNNRGWQGSPIRVGGKQYERGLGVHADSKFVYSLDGAFTNFHVIPGPDDTHHGTIEMKILVDGKQIFASGPTNSRDKKPRPELNISVEGAKKLTLIVERSDGKGGGDHAVWADAYLERPWNKQLVKSETPPSNTPVPRGKLAPFFNSYCIDCHGPNTQEADVRFDQADWNITNSDTAQRWQDVLDQLNSGDMPPEGENQPSPEELSSVLATLTGSILTARKHLTDHGGEIKMRRLNRREYANTIYDMFGFDVPLDIIPEDGESHFDTIGSEQLFNSSDFEKYLQLGTKIGEEAFVWNVATKKPRKNTREQKENNVTEKLRKKLADLDRKMKMKKAGKTWQEMGFKDAGEMKIIFSQFHVRAGHPRQYLELPKVDTGMYLCDITNWARMAQPTDIRGDYIVRIRGGVVGEPDEIRKLVRVSDHYGIKATLKVAGTPDKPETIQIRTRQSMGRSQLGIRVEENKPNFTDNTTRHYLTKLQGNNAHYDPWTSIWIDWIEIDGPIYPAKRSRFEDMLYPGKPTGGHSPMREEENARKLIEKFAFHAFRRQMPQPKFVDALHQRFLDNRRSGMNKSAAMAEVIGIVLASPAFLYLQEETNADSRNLDNRELAVRLSYFLWSCPPDDELYDANLADPSVLRAQVDRMLDDPKSSAFRDGFVCQWAELDRFDAITVEEQDHFRFNAGVRHAAKREIKEFFGALIQENLPVSNLIDSDFVMINSTLAAHYGIKSSNPKSDEFQKVNVPDGFPRGGLMTSAAFLTTGSNGERSSPVIRGALVMEKLLHDKPAPPPPNVPELGSASDTPKSNKEMVLLHQKQAVCSSCHRKMDTIGFGLENFDTTGRWRETEKVGRKQIAIEPSGTLPGGKAFSNVEELKKVLMESEEKLAEELIESIMAYALGRTIEFSDADDVATIMANLKGQQFRLRDMIHEIVACDLFGRK